MNSYKLYAIQLFAVGDYSFLLLLHLLVRVNSIIIETSASCSFKGDREEVTTHTPKHDHSPQCLQITPLTILQFLRGVEVEGFIPLYLLHGRALDVLFCSTFLSTFFFCSTTNDHVKKTKKWMRTFKEVPVPAEKIKTKNSCVFFQSPTPIPILNLSLREGLMKHLKSRIREKFARDKERFVYVIHM